MSDTAVSTPRPAEDLRLAALLALLGAIATALLFPYLLATMPEVLRKAPVSLPVLAGLQALQAFVVLGALAFGGLRLGHRVGLDAPWLRAALASRSPPRQRWGRAIVLGVLVALAIAGLSLLMDGAMPAPRHPVPDIPPIGESSAGFLASFYGGITEEIELRLFLMTLVAWGIARLRGGLSAITAWIAIVVAALLFGVGHLPAAAAIWPLDAVVVARTVVLNGVGGLLFGWLYWRQGFESAMVAHFSADLVLHVAAPLVAGLA